MSDETPEEVNYRLRNEQRCAEIARELNTKLEPEGLQFCLVMSTIDGPAEYAEKRFSNMSYCSSCNREDAARLLSELLDTWWAASTVTEPSVKTCTVLREAVYKIRGTEFTKLMANIRHRVKELSISNGPKESGNDNAELRARIAELESWSKVDDQQVASLYRQINVANARADAAEEANTQAALAVDALRKQLTAERAETARLTTVVQEQGRSNNVLLSRVSAANARADAAEQELKDTQSVLAHNQRQHDGTIAALTAERAETARVTGLARATAEAADKLRNRLAAATELLERARDMQDDSEPFACEIDAFLAAQPAPAKEEP